MGISPPSVNVNSARRLRARIIAQAQPRCRLWTGRIAGQWSDEEVARRWWNLFPGRKTDDGKPAEPEAHENVSDCSTKRSCWRAACMSI